MILPFHKIHLIFKRKLKLHCNDCSYFLVLEVLQQELLSVIDGGLPTIIQKKYFPQCVVSEFIYYTVIYSHQIPKFSTLFV